MVVEANAPWLSPHARHWGEIIQSGHQRAFGRALIAGQQRGNIGEATAAQELFACTSPVLAHDGSSGALLFFLLFFAPHLVLLVIKFGARHLPHHPPY